LDWESPVLDWESPVWDSESPAGELEDLIWMPLWKSRNAKPAARRLDCFAAAKGVPIAVAPMCAPLALKKSRCLVGAVLVLFATLAVQIWMYLVIFRMLTPMSPVPKAVQNAVQSFVWVVHLERAWAVPEAYALAVVRILGESLALCALDAGPR
jgi:hypothetical protein